MARVVSIKDIAKAAGVSNSTVSRALNDSSLISQEVRVRIQELAHSMGYTPNALAQGLLSNLTNSVGLVITTISDPFFTDVVKGVEEVAREADFSIFLATSNNDPEREIKIIETLSRRRVDGVIVAASRVTQEYADRLEEIHFPVVVINAQSEGEYRNLSSVCVDDFAGGSLAMEHLLSLGHRQIGYIGITNRPASNSRRISSFASALQQQGITLQNEWICESDVSDSGDLKSDVQAGRTLAPQLIRSGVTAIFCYCDTVAAGVLLACREMDVSIPQQVSIVGYDDNDLCEILDPPLTTISQPKRQMGQMAMDMMLTRIRDGQVSDLVLQPSLVVRASTAPPYEGLG